ncbi:hypothetical protein GYMLUDRAFT_45722 [Collybiopsis luxurians FD-317 M1]|uniref:cytochrome-b5 reductase n=1 Tax=Collybiopsis luxurians FD-317 M1 TaxID=944289 RepID=A0A0D0BRQ3_9AGAR|nr:hypothetical protein GYMLUDRAFT_45722 [Collybiopsis luxurians FD-317 M1]
MENTGKDYKAIAADTGLTEDQVEQFCTGQSHTTQEQYDAIAVSLGLEESDDAAETVCVARPRSGDPGKHEDIPHVHHDYTDAFHLLRQAHARHKEALEKGKPIEPHKGMNPPGTFTWFILSNIVPYNNDTARFDFAFEDSEVISDPPVSSTCVVVSHKSKPLWEDGPPPVEEHHYSDENIPLKTADGCLPVFRAYTPITERGTPGILSIVVKKQPAPRDHPEYPAGKMSNYIHDLKIGEPLGIMGYLQAVPSMLNYNNDAYDAVTLIAGGVGITPLIQILQYAFSDPYNETKFLLLNGNTTENDIIMKDEIARFEKEHPADFECVHVLSKPPAGWTGETGRIDAALIKKYAPPPVDSITLGIRAKVYVSGPPAMLESIAGPRGGNRYKGYSSQGELQGALKELGYTENQVHKF